MRVINEYAAKYLNNMSSSYDLNRQYYDETHLTLILSNYQDLLVDIQANDSEKYRQFFFYKWLSEMAEQQQYRLWNLLSNRGYQKDFEEFLKEIDERRMDENEIALINMLCNEEKV